nr:GTP-binding protein [Rhodoblastus acidophilus]
MVTGFLGSGKTTLLSGLLRENASGPFAIVINEFGEVALDQDLVGRVDGQVTVMSGGCLCCAIGGDLAATLLDLHARRAAQPFARIVIETSGLADPGPLLAPFAEDIRLARLFRVDGVVAVVDALQGLRELGRRRVCLKQVALADRIVLSKSDIAAPLAVSRLRDRLTEINPFAPQLIASHGTVDSGGLLQPPVRPSPAQANRRTDSAEHERGHADDIAAFCLTFDAPLRWASFVEAWTRLTDAHGDAILRIKGLLDIEGRPVAVHGVRRLLHPPETLAQWPDKSRGSRLVVIAEDLTDAQVRKYFAGVDAFGAERACSTDEARRVGQISRFT